MEKSIRKSNESKGVFCVFCGKKINENELLLQHEYGSCYCSYEHLVKGGFYGHYRKRNARDVIMEGL